MRLFFNLYKKNEWASLETHPSKQKDYDYEHFKKNISL